MKDLSDLKVLEINVEEKATGEIMAGAGVGTDGTAFMFSVKKIIGWEEELNFKLIKFIRRKISGNIAVTIQIIIILVISFASLDVSSTDRTATSGFKSSKTGFSLGTSFEQYEIYFFLPTIDINHEDIEAESTASAQIKKWKEIF